MPQTTLQLRPAQAQDFEALLALRNRAMQPSLHAIGRWDADRSRARFTAGFDAARTRHIVGSHGDRVGFVAWFDAGNALRLDHLYLEPARQQRGAGTWALAQVFAAAAGRSVLVTALRGSPANGFYARNGFVLTREEPFDLHYRRDVPVGGEHVAAR